MPLLIHECTVTFAEEFVNAWRHLAEERGNHQLENTMQKRPFQISESRNRFKSCRGAFEYFVQEKTNVDIVIISF